MFNCMMNYLSRTWWWVAIWVIIALVVGYLAGGYWGILIAFGMSVLIWLGIAYWNCSKSLSPSSGK